MDSQMIETFRRKLLTRGESVLQRRRRLLAAEHSLLENRDAEWEDLAAKHAAAGSIDSLAEPDKLVVTRIEASLDRIARGTFGDCVNCHGAIETERLRAIPEVERCAGCTH
jgi:RNA polymerase-binding transcription factor DksA